MDAIVWMLRHPDGAAVPLGANRPPLRDDGCYWLGPHKRFKADGTVQHIGTRTTRYSSDVWVLNRQVLQGDDELDKLKRELTRLTRENADLRRQLEDARALVVRSGLFERSDCECLFVRHESDLCEALSVEEMMAANVITDHTVGCEGAPCGTCSAIKAALYDDGGPVCLPCRHGDHSAHQPTLADVCVGCACEVMR